MSGEMPDEANRPDGRPAPPRRQEGGPTKEEQERQQKKFEEAVDFVADLLQSEGIDEVVKEDWGSSYGYQFNINLRELASGRQEEYEKHFEHYGSPPQDLGVVRIIELGAKNANGVRFTEVDRSDEDLDRR